MTTQGDIECPAVVDAEAIVQFAWLRMSECERPAVRRISPSVHSTTLTLPRRSTPSVGVGEDSRPEDPSPWVWPRQRSPPIHPKAVLQQYM